MSLIHSSASFCKKAVLNGEKYDIIAEKYLHVWMP